MAATSPSRTGTATRPCRSASGRGSEQVTYRVGFLITHSRWSIAAVRSAIIADADNTLAVVVGDASVMRVHAMTRRHDDLLAVGLSAGRIADVLIEPRVGSVRCVRAA